MPQEALGILLVSGLLICSNFEHLTLYVVRYGKAFDAQILGIDSGIEKGDFAKSVGAQEYIDFTTTSNNIKKVYKITNGGAHAVVAVGDPKAYAQAAEMLWISGTVSCVGIPLGRVFIATPVSGIVIKGRHKPSI